MQPHEETRKHSQRQLHSKRQLEAIEADGGDVIVLAGAGAGKTRTLVARLLHLLARRAQTPGADSGAPGEQGLRAIAAVTFTEKAAREMRNRLRREVAELVADPDLPAAERTYWQHISDGLDAARIGTIHSLCAEILRSHPEEVQIDPRFGVLDEAAALLATQDAVDAALGWAGADLDARVLFRRFKPETLRTLLSELLADRLKIAPLLTAAVWEQWPMIVSGQVSALLAAPGLQSPIAELRALDESGVIARACRANDTLAPDLVTLLAAWNRLEDAAAAGDMVQTLEQLAVVRGCVKGNKGRKEAWQPDAPPKAAVKLLRETIDNSLLGTLLDDVDPALDAELAALLPQVRRLFDQVVAVYDQAKRERATLDFDDLEQKALDLLARPAVRTRWQDQIDAVLVDEFQDTNGRQRDLVRHLAGDRGCLFVVGDAKQSIYRFRGAQVQVIRHEHERISKANGRVVELAASYRTHTALLDALNALMRSVLSADTAPWHAPFAALTAERTECEHGLAEPFVELHLAAGSKGEGALETAARALAARLAQLRQESGGKLEYGDIAILCRRAGSFPAYEAALEEAGIPYVTVAGRGFYDRPEIRDLRITLQALADPTDDLALAGLLRSAAVGLADADLFDLRFGPDGEVRSLWPALQAATQAPGAPALLVRAADLVATHHALAGRIGVADLIKRWIDATDYVAILAAAGNARAARNVAKLLDDAHRSGLVSVAEFLEYIANVQDVGGREGEARGDDTGAVQIMTVHRAKGLEFPVVVIGDAAAKGSSDKSHVLADETLGLVPKLQDEKRKTPLVWALAKATNADQEEAELNRLFYVAATRSADKLILSGTVEVKVGKCGKGDGWLCQLLAALDTNPLPATVAPGGAAAHPLVSMLGGQTVGGAVYELKWGQEGVELEGLEAGETTAAHTDAQQRAATDAQQRAARWTIGTAWTGAMVEPIHTPDADRDDRQAEVLEREAREVVWRVAPAVEQTRAPAWLVGNLVHEAIAAWRLPVDGGLAAWVRARSRTYGLGDEARLDDAVVKVRRLLRRFQDSPLYAEIAGADRRLHELPYTWLHDGREETGTIDLLYCRDGVWTLVDFKTRHIRTPDQRREVLDAGNFQQQVRRYAAAVAGLTGLATADLRVVICLLDDKGEVSLEPVPIGSAVG